MSSTILLHSASPLISAEFISLIKSSSGDDSEGFGWNVENKYYLAQLEFKSIADATGITEEPALIVLVDRTQTPSTTLTSLLESLLSNEKEFEVALLVTYSKTEINLIDEVAWDDLAMAHGLEWIDVSGSISTDSKREVGKEEGGISRVIEALQAHLWEGLVRKEVPARSELENSKIDLIAEENEGAEVRNFGAPPLPAPRPFVPIDPAFPSNFLPALTSKVIAAKGFEDDFDPFVQPSTSKTTFDKDPAFTDYPPPAPRKTFAPPLPASLDFSSSSHFLLLDDEDDEGLEMTDGDEKDMDSLFERMKIVRERAKTMGMEERRKLAEELLLELL